MRIPQDKIEEVRNATDIVDLIGGFVRLKKRGKNYVGLCPFHQEKTSWCNTESFMHYSVDIAFDTRSAETEFRCIVNKPVE